MKTIFVKLLLSAAALAAFAGLANADPFKSPKECIAGKRVTDKQSRTGTITRMANDNLCEVKIDESGKTEYFIFWMLTEAGKSSGTSDKLVPGTYECFANGQYTFMDMQITGPDTYKSDAGTGKFRVEASQKITFLSGSLSKYTAKLMAGPAIGLSTNGGQFYGTTCELKKK